MFYLEESLKYFKTVCPGELEEARQYIFPHLQSIKTIEDFNQYYRHTERRFLSAYDDFQLAMQLFRNADLEEVYSRFSAKLEVIQAESRLNSHRTDLKELSKVFAICHFQRISGFELNPNEYENTVDSDNVSVE